MTDIDIFKSLAAKAAKTGRVAAGDPTGDAAAAISRNDAAAMSESDKMLLQAMQDITTALNKEAPKSARLEAQKRVVGWQRRWKRKLRQELLAEVEAKPRKAGGQ
jgi:hypothetical protein